MKISQEQYLFLNRPLEGALPEIGKIAGEMCVFFTAYILMRKIKNNRNICKNVENKGINKVFLKSQFFFKKSIFLSNAI